MAATLIRKNSSIGNAISEMNRLRTFDWELQSEIVNQETLTLQAKGELMEIHRRLREFRMKLEVEWDARSLQPRRA